LKDYLPDEELIEAVLDLACHGIPVAFEDIVIVVDDATRHVVLGHMLENLRNLIL